MNFQDKKDFYVYRILIPILGISIFVFLCFLLVNKILQKNKVADEFARVIYKENGVQPSQLFLTPSNLMTVAPQILDHLKILSDDVSLLDGKNLDLGGRQNIPIAVIIENHPDARPQMAGLEKAKIVYEALAEGGITRYLAIFDPVGVAKIGPVRSARPYFIHWAEEFGGVFCHIGGSDEALSYLRNSSHILNVEENQGDGIIWRETDYLKPHNAFTSTNNLYKKALAVVWQKQITESFLKFKLKEYPVKEPLLGVTLDFSFPSYKVKWQYDSQENQYLRYLAGRLQEGITAKNIIVQIVPAKLIEEDEKGRLDMYLIGQGKAIYFLDGEKKEGTWEKDDFQVKTVFYDAEHQEMQFNRGKTWIEVIDSEIKVF